MGSRQPPEGGSEGISLERAFGFIFLVISGHASCFWPFTRKKFGSQAFAWNGVAAMAVMFLYAGFGRCGEMPVFFALWLFLVLCHRYTTLRRLWRGVEIHSRDHGEPWVAERLFRIRPENEFAAKAFGEPLLLVGVGALVATQSESLGMFVASGAVSQFLKQVIERGIREAELQAMRDQEIEMRAVMSRYRGRS